MANFGSNPKEELLTHERILLQTIKFDLQVQHPYFFLLKYAKSLRGVVWRCGLEGGLEFTKSVVFCIVGDKRKTEELVQTAWTFVNDRFVRFLIFFHFLFLLLVLFYSTAQQPEGL